MKVRINTNAKTIVFSEEPTALQLTNYFGSDVWGRYKIKIREPDIEITIKEVDLDDVNTDLIEDFKNEL